MPDLKDYSPPRTRQEEREAALERLVRSFEASRDPNQFRQLYDLCWGPLVRFFVRQGFPKSEAEDFSQNVMLRVYDHIGTFRHEARFKTWLFRIAANEWKNALRSKGAQMRRADEVPLESFEPEGDEKSLAQELADLEEGPLERLLAGERSHLIREALKELSPRERQCLTLRSAKDLKYREIASVLRLSLASVKTHIVHGYRRLRPLLERHSEVFEAQEPPG